MTAMFNLISIIIGIVAIPLALLAFLPLLGWAYWLIVPIGLLGAGIGQMSPNKTGRNMNLFVVVIGVIRLMLGGGII